MSLPSTDVMSNASSTEEIEGLNIPERRDGERTAMSLSAARCSEDMPGDSITGDGERSGCKRGDTAWTSVNGEPTSATARSVSMLGICAALRSTKGDGMRESVSGSERTSSYALALPVRGVP